VNYAQEPNLATSDFIDLLHRSGLAARRPVADPARIADMIANADIIITARIDRVLVGVSRAITDFAWCTYLSDLAVDQRYQRQGIGRELIRRTHEAAGLVTTLILIAAPDARTYYPHIGMQHQDACWMIHRTDPENP
jgi:predicted N-acetyltransferase YhbS